MKGGVLHERAWHWLDRVYFEHYLPWRKTRVALLASEEKRARVALGDKEGRGRPDTNWLSPKNRLRTHLGLAAAVAEGRAGVLFWVQPLGFFDFWHVGPGVVVVSFAEPGEAYEAVRADATDIASRAQALADPTRLMILRIIRRYGAGNTEIAGFLGLARPTVSVHAKILREAGLIDTRQEGRQSSHKVDPGELRRLFRDLRAFLDLPEEPS